VRIGLYLAERIADTLFKLTVNCYCDSMRPPNEIVLKKEHMDMLVFVIKDRLELLADLRAEREFDEQDEKEESMLIMMMDRFKKAGLKWKKLKDGMYETTLPEGNQLLRVET